MNKDQVKGVTKDIAGKVQEEAGKLDLAAKSSRSRDFPSRYQEKCKRASAMALKEAVNKANKP